MRRQQLTPAQPVAKMPVAKDQPTLTAVVPSDPGPTAKPVEPTKPTVEPVTPATTEIVTATNGLPVPPVGQATLAVTAKPVEPTALTAPTTKRGKGGSAKVMKPATTITTTGKPGKPVVRQLTKAPAAVTLDAAKPVKRETQVSSDDELPLVTPSYEEALAPLIAKCKLLIVELAQKAAEIMPNVVKIYEVHKRYYGKYPTRKMVQKMLQLDDKTVQRIGQLFKSGKFYGKLLDGKFVNTNAPSLHWYEVAREKSQGKIPATELVKIVEGCKTSAEIVAKVTPAETKKETPVGYTLDVKGYAKRGAKDGVDIKYNGGTASPWKEDEQREWINLMIETSAEVMVTAIGMATILASNTANLPQGWNKELYAKNLAAWGKRIREVMCNKTELLKRSHREDNTSVGKILEEMFSDGFDSPAPAIPAPAIPAETAQSSPAQVKSARRQWKWDREPNDGTWSCGDFTLLKVDVGSEWLWEIRYRGHVLAHEKTLTDAKKAAETATNLPKEDGGIFPPALADTTTAAIPAPADPVATAPPASPQPTPEQPSPAQPTSAPAALRKWDKVNEHFWASAPYSIEKISREDKQGEFVLRKDSGIIGDFNTVEAAMETVDIIAAV